MNHTVEDARGGIARRYDDLNDAIYNWQQIIGAFYGKYFTLYASLMFSMGMGAFLGFTGDNCYGKIPVSSPLFWIALVIALFFFFQTFILVKLTLGRIFRLLTVIICGHYLSYQAYGYWSLRNVELAEKNLTSVPAHKLAGAVDVIQGVGVCKPFAYANMTYGHLWLTIPAIALIAICFFTGHNQT